MWFRFKDGPRYEETTVFSQRGAFALLRDHVIQQGPTFKHRMETSIDAGEVTVHYTDENNQEKTETQHLNLPTDLAILFTLLKNIQPDVPKTTVSYVATMPKPRVASLEIIPQGQKPFSIGSHTHKALLFAIRAKIGGITVR